ncbi:MAG: hypothetical protein KJ556_20515 [Gammaproteobacteria bacterium]|nr:hypothetical protein [Gammaproteobacteria bacterium]
MTQLLINNFSLGWQNRASQELMKPQALFVCKDISMESLGELTCRRLNRRNEYFSGITAASAIKNYYHVDVEGTNKRLRFYTIDNTLYRYNSTTNVTTAIATNMTGGYVYYAAIKPLLSSYTHVFVTDGTTYLADDGSTTKTWGIDPPSGSLKLSVGSIVGSLSAGAYKYIYTFYDSNTGTESDPSPITASLTVAVNASVSITNISVSSASRVTSRRLYRTIAGGGSYYLVATIPDNVTTIYTDTVADSRLSVSAVMDQGIPPTGDIVVAYGNQLFMAGDPDYPQRLYFCLPNKPDSFPSVYYVETESADDKILNIAKFAGKLYLVQGEGIATLLGSDATNYTTYNTRSHIGTIARWSTAVGPDGIYFVGSDGIYRFDGLQSSRVSDSISRIFSKMPTELYEIVDMNSVGSVSRGRFLNGVYYLILPMLDTNGNVTNKLLTYDTLEKSSENVGTWLLHNVELDDIFADGGRGRVYGSMETSSGSGSYSVYNLMEYASSTVDTPSPEAVTKEFDIIAPSTFELSGGGITAQRRDDVVELLRKFRVDAVGDWTITFYLDGVNVHSITLTGLSAANKYKWRNFPNNLRGGSLYVKIEGTGSPRPDSHVFKALEVR